MNRILMQGNRVIGEAAIRAGCRFYAGYPITPQNELTEYMADNMRRAKGGTFIQAESEIAAINMVLGASAAGARAMTSSSSPGISLKQEGISSLAADELPAVIVNMMRGGPGLGASFEASHLLRQRAQFFQKLFAFGGPALFQITELHRAALNLIANRMQPREPSDPRCTP